MISYCCKKKLIEIRTRVFGGNEQRSKHIECKQIFIKLISGMNCGINIFSIAGEDSDRKDKQVD